MSGNYNLLGYSTNLGEPLIINDIVLDTSLDKLTVSKELEISGNLHITGGGTGKIVFNDGSGPNSHEHAQLDAEGDGTNGGKFLVKTRLDASGGPVREVMSVDNLGVLELSLNSLKLPTDTTSLGDVSGSISGSTLTIDGKNLSYGFVRLQVPATSTITTLTATNMRQSGQILVHIEGSASGTLTIQGSDAGGITNASVNFTANVEVANTRDCILTLFSSNGKVLISAGKYI